MRLNKSLALAVPAALLLALAACGGTQTPATAAASATASATEEYVATLSGSQEVPPTATSGTGTAAVSFDPATSQLTWTVNYADLTTPLRAAHFHGPAAPGVAADVQVPITAGPSPLTGSATLTPEQTAALRGGLLYVNLHTETYPGGEIRGQVTAAR